MPPLTPSVWLLDACSALNIFASGHAAAILRAPIRGQTVSYAIVNIVREETAFLRRGGNGDDADELDPIDWASIVSSGLIREEAAITPNELASFVALATQLDDGEALTLAVSNVRGYGIVTDERKAQRFLGSIAHLGTPDLMHNWSTLNGVDAHILSVALRDIAERASFTAPRGHPLRTWWNDTIANALKIKSS